MKIIKPGIVLFVCLAISFCKPGNTSRNGTFVKPGKGKDYHIILITIDTLRFDRISVNSYEYVKTPNIDKLASKSLVFKRAFAHNPVTLPSHINIITGTTPLYHGISDNSGFRLDDRFLTLAEYLKGKGYKTGAFIGAFPLDSRFGLSQGFDEYDDNYGTHNSLKLFFVERQANKVIEPALDWISNQPDTVKWFTWIHLFDPHQPYFPPAPYDKEYANDPYSGEAAYVDEQLGILFDFLEEKQLIGKTIIVFTADHGEALGEKGEQSHSYFAYNNTIHVPLIVYVPGMQPGIVSENASHMDIFPTICDIFDFEIPQHLQGESLLPISQGEKREKSQIYFESLTPYLNRGWAPLRGFIDGNLKFIDLPIKEVYDLGQDMEENQNLAESHNISKLKGKLKKLMKGLEGENKIKREEKLDPQLQEKMKSLGYISESTSSKKKVFTKEDDLKTLLPLHNEMLNALNDYQTGNVSEAITSLQSIVGKSPHFILVYNHLANIYKETGQIDKSVQILKKGLSSNPKNTSLLSKLGIVLVDTNQKQEAIEILKKCVEIESGDPENFNYLGVAYYRTGNFQLALENYQKALELDGNYASVFNNIGSLYLSVYLGRKDERAYEAALQNFNKAIEIDPSLSTAFNGRGAAYKFKNRIPEAIEDWKKSIELKPDYIEPYFNVGISYLQTGDKSSAMVYFNMCKQRFYHILPDPEKQRLERLLNEARN
jgi:arylsulfatase A-like enzyme/Flp pilus assembly protein TadD